MTWQFSCERLAIARESRDMTQDVLAGIIGTPAQQISRWETGAVKPGQESLEKICNALQIHPKFFYVESGNNGNDCHD